MFSREMRVAGFDPELHAALEAEAEGDPGKRCDGGCQHVDTGIRVGTPAATTRGFREPEVKALAGWMCDILSDIGNPSVIARVREQVTQLCTRFPVYRG